jgi:hypothetical protein
LTSAGAVSQTRQDDSRCHQRQIACHRLLRANTTRWHCLRKFTQKDRSYVSDPMRPLYCSCGSTTRIEIHCTIASIKALNSANHVPHGCISMRQSASGMVQMEQNLRGIMDKDEANRLTRAIARTHVDWIEVRGIEYNPLTSTYELKCMYQRYRGLTSWTELCIRSPRQWIELLQSTVTTLDLNSPEQGSRK